MCMSSTCIITVFNNTAHHIYKIICFYIKTDIKANKTNKNISLWHSFTRTYTLYLSKGR